MGQGDDIVALEDDLYVYNSHVNSWTFLAIIRET